MISITPKRSARPKMSNVAYWKLHVAPWLSMPAIRAKATRAFGSMTVGSVLVATACFRFFVLFRGTAEMLRWFDEKTASAHQRFPLALDPRQSADNSGWYS